LKSTGIEAGQGGGEILIAVGDLERLTEGLESSQGFLAQFALEIRITVAAEDPARGEAMLVDRAGWTLLVRAAAGGHRVELLRAEFRGQVRELGRRDEEPVIVGREVTTRATRLAPAGPGEVLLRLRVDPVVKRRYFFEEPAVSLGLSHHGLFSRIFSISAHV
jgi:hypothetical protein